MDSDCDEPLPSLPKGINIVKKFVPCSNDTGNSQVIENLGNLITKVKTDRLKKVKKSIIDKNDERLEILITELRNTYNNAKNF